MEIKIKYFTEDLTKLEYVDGKSDWIDLRAAEDVVLKKNEFKLIRLGVGMILPEGYEAHVVPRSSTFKNYGIIQTNHQAVIDNSYNGDNDEWLYPVFCLETRHFKDGSPVTIINKNDRICQFRIVQNQPKLSFTVLDHLNIKDRDGFGSTGVK